MLGVRASVTSLPRDREDAVVPTGQPLYGDSTAATALDRLVRRHAAGVYRTCLSITRNAHDAEDAAQATFIALAEQLRSGAPIVHEAAWLQQVARRTSLDLYRTRQRRRRREDAARVSDAHDASPPGLGIDAAELAALVREELQSLPADYRTPLILHYFGGLSAGQIARQLNCGPKALGMRLLRGRRMLRERLARRGVVVGAIALTAALEAATRNLVAAPVAWPVTTAMPDASTLLNLSGSVGTRVETFADPAGLIPRILGALQRPRQRWIFAALLLGSAAMSGGAKQLLESAARAVANPTGWRQSLESFTPLWRWLPRPTGKPLRLSNSEPKEEQAMPPGGGMVGIATGPAFPPPGPVQPVPAPPPWLTRQTTRGTEPVVFRSIDRPTDAPLENSPLHQMAASARVPAGPPPARTPWAGLSYVEPPRLFVGLDLTDRSDLHDFAAGGPTAGDPDFGSALALVGDDNALLEDLALSGSVNLIDPLLAEAAMDGSSGRLQSEQAAWSPARLESSPTAGSAPPISAAHGVPGIPEPALTAPLALLGVLLVRRRRRPE